MTSFVSNIRTARHLFIALSLAGSLAACSTTTTAPDAAVDTDTETQVIAMGCIDTDAQWAVGKKLDDDVIAKAKADAQAKTVRVILPGTAVTMEYNGARLNLIINIKGVIERVRCG